MPLAQIDVLDIYYELHGSGPRVLNIGGTAGDLRRTRPDRSPLNRRLEVLSYDQRGHGRSSKPETEYTMADYADDAAALVRTVGWDRCHVVGTSFGGMVALNLAVRHGELIDRIALNCTSAGGRSSSYPLHELGALAADEAFETRMRLFDTRWDPSAAEPIPGLGRFYDELVAASKTTPDPATRDGLERQLRARAEHDVVDDLPAIAHPTLVSAGRYDGLAPVGNSEFLADALPNAALSVFEGGHYFLLQDRTAFGTIGDHLLGGAA